MLSVCIAVRDSCLNESLIQPERVSCLLVLVSCPCSSCPDGFHGTYCETPTAKRRGSRVGFVLSAILFLLILLGVALFLGFYLRKKTVAIESVSAIPSYSPLLLVFH